ncbi:MAG: cytochrome ubiquinol oxidase subunit I, partial [Pseudomonadota bacterium]
PISFATNWFEIIFNPSMPYRFTHMMLASGLTVAFLIAGLSAFRWLLGDRSGGVRATLKTGVYMGAMLIPAQIFMGDLHGLNTLEYQPQKVAAMEGNWETDTGVPLILFAIPDEETRSNSMELGVPNMASIILKHKADGVVPGLNDFVTAEGEVLHPPVAPVFWSFRIMVGTGFAMLALSWFAAFMMLRRGRGAEGVPKLALYAMVPMAFSGWVATLAGWYTTEIGRQPWLVQGVLTTEQAVADVPAPFVGITLAAYLSIYVLLLGAYIAVLFYLARKGVTGDVPRPRTPLAGQAVASNVPAE